MRRVIVAAALTVALVTGGYASTAHGADENAPHGGPGSHPHHVHTGNGGCRDLSGPDFEPGDRGRHRASNESGEEHGPYHGTCASHVHQ